MPEIERTVRHYISYLSDLRLSCERAYSPPKVEPLPEDASADQKISTLEEEQGVTRKISAAQGAVKSDNPVAGTSTSVEEAVQSSLENKLDEILKNQRTLQAAAVKKGGKRFAGKQRPGPKPSDNCRACIGRGHWARSCPSLNEGGAGRRPSVQP